MLKENKLSNWRNNAARSTYYKLGIPIFAISFSLLGSDKSPHTFISSEPSTPISSPLNKAVEPQIDTKQLPRHDLPQLLPNEIHHIRMGNFPGTGIVNMVSLGDSITFIGAYDIDGWAQKYAGHISAASMQNVDLTSLGMSGYKSRDIVDALYDVRFTEPLRNADIITLEVGLNDFISMRGMYTQELCGSNMNQECLDEMLANFKNNWDIILSRIKQINSKSAAIQVMDIYYPLSGYDEQLGIFNVLNSYLKQMNQHIAESANLNGIQLARIHSAFNSENGDSHIEQKYILPDVVHPSEDGHEAIYEAFVRASSTPLPIK